MEDALREQVALLKESGYLCLNPCCNGRCSASSRGLYLMSSSRTVLILVVMEDALRDYPFCRIEDLWDCLNPCCNGRCSASPGFLFVARRKKSLNPCCNGRCSASISPINNIVRNKYVLILVVMEDALRAWQQQVQQKAPWES